MKADTRETTFVRDKVREFLRAHPAWPEYRDRRGLASRSMIGIDMADFIDYVSLFADHNIRHKVAARRLVAKRQYAAGQAFIRR